MANAKRHYTPAEYVTCKAQGQITGGTFVEVAADIDWRNPVVKTATAGKKAFGVAASDAPSGTAFVVLRIGNIVDVQANGTIAAGDEVEVHSAGGKAAKLASGKPVGLALNAAKNGVVTIALT